MLMQCAIQVRGKYIILDTSYTYSTSGVPLAPRGGGELGKLVYNPKMGHKR